MKLKYNKEYIDSHDCDFILFWKPKEPNGFLGQWFPSRFVDSDGCVYSCAEQYMMVQKARLFNDLEVADEIMRENVPAKMRGLGRKIKNFNQSVWNEHKISIVFNGNLLKFSQNPKLAQQLLRTGSSVLVEVSPYDAIWGIKSATVNDWNGENLLGFILMEVRDNLNEKDDTEQ